MIQFLADLTRLIETARAATMSEAEFRAAMVGCLVVIQLSKAFTQEQKAVAKTILLGAVR